MIMIQSISFYEKPAILDIFPVIKSITLYSIAWHKKTHFQFWSKAVVHQFKAFLVWNSLLFCKTVVGDSEVVKISVGLYWINEVELKLLNHMGLNVWSLSCIKLLERLKIWKYNLGFCRLQYLLKLVPSTDNLWFCLVSLFYNSSQSLLYSTTYAFCPVF